VEANNQGEISLKLSLNHRIISIQTNTFHKFSILFYVNKICLNLMSHNIVIPGSQRPLLKTINRVSPPSVCFLSVRELGELGVNNKSSLQVSICSRQLCKDRQTFLQFLRLFDTPLIKSVLKKKKHLRSRP
jgi:hypothetical protein